MPNLYMGIIYGIIHYINHKTLQNDKSNVN